MKIMNVKKSEFADFFNNKIGQSQIDELSKQGRIRRRDKEIVMIKKESKDAVSIPIN